jgi:hypothetical protein
MVVETTLGAAFRIAAIPHAHVYGIDRRLVLGKRMEDEKFPYRLGVDPSLAERGIKAAPTPTMRRLEAQVNGRRDGRVCGEDGVSELEEGVAPTAEAFVERAAEADKSIVRFHDAPIMRSPTAPRISCPTLELKRNSPLKK